ncbi:copper amine oxidase N-terminal domain-containing protein [Paenibacillus sp. GYB003]|uniref:copper amine oxidase N-terminal domain-containing protein n=1 Tax=Paenibacillus sp. GYB003 TaxID=2994392 RepID=UPI002F9620F5
MHLEKSMSNARLACLIGALLALLLVVGTRPQQAMAQAEAPIKVFVDTNRIGFSVDPLLEDGTTLVQLRPLFEAMGIELQWDNDNRIVTGKTTGLVFALPIDGTKATVNGSEVALEQAARIVDGNTLVPLRFVGEATGALVVWDGDRREITLFTEKWIRSLGLTRKQAEDILAKWQAEGAGRQPDETPAPVDGSDGDDRAEPDEDDEETPAAVPADLDRLRGMYYGLREDIGGFECGGVCWDFYTFLPDGKIVVGEPERGGPETIDCSTQACADYRIENGSLIVDGADTHTIRVSEKGNLFVDDVLLSPVPAAQDGLKLQGEYVYRGYSGMIGIHTFSSAWEEKITFRSDGTFESDDLQLGTLNTGSSTTNSSASSKRSGTYAVKGHTIALHFKDGQEEEQAYLFFVHPGKDGKPNAEDVQIGSRNFYVDRDE